MSDKNGGFEKDGEAALLAEALMKALRNNAVKVSPGVDLRRWPKVREMLNMYCGYKLAEDEIIIFRIDGELWFISDIGLRMLTPREVFDAQGFPPDYIIDYDYMGNRYQKSKQVARAGNAVCPPVAAALVRANLPEWCGKAISTMAELEETAG